jgi:uncharacterized LabA/DUF88 family protein
LREKNVKKKKTKTKKSGEVPTETISRPSPVFILLIDADNTSADLFPQIIQKAEMWGIITVRHVHGNQETLLSPKWKALCLQYALQPILHMGISGAKNATDIALTVDAMDLLWVQKEHTPAFCLVTGDQDFTALVLRLRSQGCAVYCIGKTTKAEALTKVCTQFIPIGQFSPSPEVALPKAAPPQKKPLTPKKEKPKVREPQPPLDPALLQFLIGTIEKLSTEEHGEWISIPRLGARLKLLNPQFQAKSAGYKNLPALIESQTEVFEHRRLGVHLEVRVKKQQKNGGM